MTVLDIVDDLRDAGLTHKGIARNLGVSVWTVGAWARGDHSPHPYFLRKLTALHAHLSAWGA